MSRIRTVALVVTVAALSALLAACGGGSSDPQTVVEEATLKGVESGKLEAKISLKSEAKKSGNLDVELSGPFQSGGKGNLPQLAMKLKAGGTLNGEAVDFEGGLTLLSDRAFIGLGGTEYEVDPTTFGFIKSGFEQAQQQGGEEAEAGDVTACQQALSGIELAEFITNAESEGDVEVAGTATTKVSGDLDTAGAIDALIKLVEDPACAAQIEAAGPLPLGELEKAKGELTSAVKKAHVEVYVGSDHIIRKISAELTIEPKGGSRERTEIELEMTLSGVNEEQEIKAPSGAKPLEDLFRKLGINPLELFQEGGGIGGVIEGLLGGAGGLGGSGEGSLGGGLEELGELGGGKQQEYVECLQGAETSADLQKCASLLQ